MNKFRVLSVDDDPKLSRLVKLVLEKTGQYEVQEVGRPHEVLEAARTFAPELILLDVDMPGKSGGEVARDLQSDPDLYHIPIIFFTSLISSGDTGGGDVFLNGKHYLPKPVDSMVLIDVVDAVFRNNVGCRSEAV